MQYAIPSGTKKQHLQDNRSDRSGTIYQSRNIDLDEEGYIKLSPATYAMMTTDNDADFDTVDAMFPCNTAIFLNSSQVFSGTIGVSTLTNRTGNTNKPEPGTEEDVVYFNDTEVVSQGANIKYRSASTTWTTVATTLSTSFPTVMCSWEAVGSLAVGNSNTVKFVNSSWAVNGTVLTLPADYQVSGLASNGQFLFIATRSKSGAEAKLFVIDSIQAAVDQGYGCGAFEMFSLRVFKSSVVTLTSLGQLLRYNGGGFDELGSLPVYSTGVEWADATNNASVMSNRALTVDGDLVLANISSFTQDGRWQMLPGFLSGVWCYDDRNGSLYHKFSPSYTRVEVIDGSAVTVSTTNNNFTLTSGNLNNVSTGMPLAYNRGGSTTIPELRPARAYYLIKDSSTVFRMADTYSDAIAGTAVDISGTGSSSQKWSVFKTNDFGWGLFSSRMSIAVLNSKLYDSDYAGRYAITAELGQKQAVNTQVTVLNGVCPFLPNRGYFVVPKWESEDIEDMQQKFYIKHVPLRADEKIRIKFKALDYAEFPTTSVQYDNTSNWVADWTDTDTFTTVADLSDVAAGDEIEIVAGVGSGHMAHVSSISSNAGTYTVNLDEAFPYAVSGDEFLFTADKWTYLDEITSSSPTNDAGYFETSPNVSSKFIMYKVEMRGTGIKISDAQGYSSTEKSVQVYNQ